MRILIALLLSTALAVGNPLYALAGGTPIIVTGAATITFHTDSATGAGNTVNPVTFSSMNSGTAAADRITVVTIVGSNRGYATGVTINGVTATMAARANNGSAAINNEIWYAPNPTGTTATVVITYSSGTAGSFACAIGSVNGATGGLSDTDSAGTTGVNNISVSALTIPTNGVAAFVGASGAQATPVSWTNATEFNDDDRQDFRFSAASTNVAGTPTITLDGGDSSSHVLVGAAWTAAPPSTLLTGLLAWYRFDESSGNAADSAGGGKTLTNTNSVAFAAGKIGNAADLEQASSQWFHRNDAAFNLPGDMTVSVWIKAESQSLDGYGAGIVVNTQNEIEGSWMFQQAIQRPYFQSRMTGGAWGSTYGSPTDIPVGSWCHLVARRSSGTVTVWVNNVNVTIGGDTGTSGWGQDFFAVGTAYSAGNTWNFDGLVDLLGVWSRALTNAEIGQLYNGGAGFDPTQ